jgi:transposase InsO family protein
MDMQSNPDRDMKFILVYQDHLTKFVLLQSLHSKRADEVAYHLLNIYTTFGVPNILHSDNGREFCNQIIQSLCGMI